MPAFPAAYSPSPSQSVIHGIPGRWPRQKQIRSKRRHRAPPRRPKAPMRPHPPRAPFRSELLTRRLVDRRQAEHQPSSSRVRIRQRSLESLVIGRSPIGRACHHARSGARLPDPTLGATKRDRALLLRHPSALRSRPQFVDHWQGRNRFVQRVLALNRTV